MLPIIGSVISGIADFVGGRKANEQNRQTALDQMMFQKEMSDTAHRREVADLRAAGLNPILSARYGGSSTPAGSTWTAQNVLGQAANSARQALGQFQDYRLKHQEERIKEPAARAADLATKGFDTITNTVPTVAAAVQAAVSTVLDKVDQVKNVASAATADVKSAYTGMKMDAGQTASEARNVVQRVRDIVTTPGQSFTSTARSIREVLFPRVVGNFDIEGRGPYKALQVISGIQDPQLRREARIALEQQQIRKHNPSFSRHGFR